MHRVPLPPPIEVIEEAILDGSHRPTAEWLARRAEEFASSQAVAQEIADLARNILAAEDEDGPARLRELRPTLDRLRPLLEGQRRSLLSTGRGCEPVFGSAEEFRAYQDELERQRRIAFAREQVEAEMNPDEEKWVPPEGPTNLAEMLAEPDDPSPRFVVEDLHPHAGYATLVAAQKTGKTSLAIGLLRDLVDGRRVFGRFEGRLPEGANVAYLNFEMTRTEMHEWVKRARIEHPERVCILNLRGRPNPFLTAEGRVWLIGWLQSNRVWYWCLDSYAAAYTGDSENDNAQSRRFLSSIGRIARESAADNVLVLAHTGKYNDGVARGATTLDDWADSIITLTKDRTGRRFLSARGRDVDLGEGELEWDARTGTFTGFHDGVSRERSAASQKEEELRRRVLDTARGAGGLGKRDFRDKVTGAANAKIDRAVGDLEFEGDLVLVDGKYYVAGEEPGAGQGALDA